MYRTNKYSLCRLVNSKNVSWIEPNGGYTMWLKFDKTKLTYEEINRAFQSHKVRLAFGRDFFPFPEARKYFRLAIASLNEAEIVEGVNRLAESIKEIYQK